MIFRVSHRQRIIVIVLISFFLIIIFFTGYFFNQYNVWKNWFDDISLEQNNKELKKENLQLFAEMSSLELDLDVNRKSIELLKQHTERYSTTISKLKNELRFYKGLVNAASDELGVTIQNVWLKMTHTQIKKQIKKSLRNKEQTKKQNTQTYDMVKFSITIVNRMSSKRYHRGKIQFDLFDAQGEKLSQWEMLDGQARKLNKLKVRFRYFQKLDGFLLINKNISVKKIKISFIDSKKGDLGIGQQFDWTIDKDLNYVGQ